MLGPLCVFNFCGFFAFSKRENPKLFMCGALIGPFFPIVL